VGIRAGRRRRLKPFRDSRCRVGELVVSVEGEVASQEVPNLGAAGILRGRGIGVYHGNDECVVREGGATDGEGRLLGCL
jgi:hypothetical protein